MATTTSAPSAGSMLSAANSLQSAVSAARDRVLSQNAASGTQAAPEVQEFRKDIRKSPFNTPSAATDMGILIKDKSRLNVISGLAAGDAADFYKFKVINRGDLTLGQVGDEGLRVQVMSRYGAVIADSNENTGSTNENYKKMQNGAFEMDRGDYILRVTRERGTDTNKGLNYALQVRMGNYTQDFDTVVKQPQPGDGVPSQSAANQKLQDMLNSSTSFIGSLPAIGTSATSKLQGVLGGGSVFNVQSLGSIKGGSVNILA